MYHFSVPLFKFLQGCPAGGSAQPAKRPSHYLLTPPCGKFHVPPDLTKEFHAAYANAVTVHGANPGMVEAKGVLFRLFVDLDIKLLAGEAVADEDRVQLVANVHAVAVGMFGADTVCAITACEPYAKGDIIKAGIHMIWPTTHVDAEQASFFRAACIGALNDKYGGRVVGLGTWEDIVDGSVYREGTGLRMTGAGKNDAGATPYLPYLRLDAAGQIQERVPKEASYVNFLLWVNLTSIRACSDGAQQASSTPGLLAAGRMAKASSRQGSRKQGGDLNSSGMLPLPLGQNMELVRAVKGIITNSLAADFVTAPVRNLHISSIKGVTYVALSLMSRRCLNLVDREYHTNNNSYLVLEFDTKTSRAQVVQKCHNQKANVKGRFGSCLQLRCDISRAPTFSARPLVGTEEYLRNMAKIPNLVKQAWAQVAMGCS